MEDNNKTLIDYVKYVLSYNPSKGTIPHAIIIEGNDEQKGEEIASLITQMAMCLDNVDKPCGLCNACLKSIKNIHPDIVKVTGNTGIRSFHIDKIREIRQSAYVVPNEGKYKIYILENAQNMTIPAQNALLKILEEPPNAVIFILLSKSSHELLDTIRSRCQIISFNSNGTLVNEDIYKIAENILQSLLDTKEFNLLISSSVLLKNKEDFNNVLSCLIMLLRDAYVILYDGKSKYFNSDINKKISNRFSCITILKLIDKIKEIQSYLHYNVNLNLLTTYFCSQLYEIVLN